MRAVVDDSSFVDYSRFKPRVFKPLEACVRQLVSEVLNSNAPSTPTNGQGLFHSYRRRTKGEV
jgi:hypothetical protein